ncbi:type II secretion system protein E [mine drainage metagenome]|uniref:Type II secretion system protein E n=1 Tax=mine drainage metagenome TaxID=410659 RepID=A0A1J5SJ74_9ZZZZ
MPNPRNKLFVEHITALPDFDYVREVRALLDQHPDDASLLSAVIDQKLVSKDDACRLWGDVIGHAYVDPFASVITEEAIACIPAEIAKKVKCIGLYVLGGTLTVALAAPDDKDIVRRLGQIAQMPVSPVFALEREIEDAIAIHYSNEKSIEESLAGLERASIFDQTDVSNERLALLADSDSIVAFVDEIIYYALRERATDIHIEPQETLARVRFRVDGNLREMLTYSRKLHRAFISRLKIISNLNIAESRFPQDGRFAMSIGTQTANFRFSCIPTQFGEKAVIRILTFSGKKAMMTLDKMMMSQNVLQPFKRLIRNPNGIIFVTGPTGSGKTTTLYAALHEINTPDVNISTIEDPIEIQLAGITQTQVNAHIDLKFSTILRSLLRQDPDIILIGEIRDLETAKIATEAALTGHLVLATLHTNTAAQAIVRLMEIGVEPYMVAPSVVGVLAQRLAARICESCKEPYHPSRELLGKYFLEEGLTDVPFYRGRGCPACRGTGYKGRIAFHELIVITEEIRTMITERRSAQEITRAAAKIGYRSLRYDGLKKVLLGLTTIEEIEANTSFEWAT